MLNDVLFCNEITLDSEVEVISSKATVVRNSLLSDAINGSLVDDSGRPLIDEAVNAIEAQVDVIYQAMIEHGIFAGSSSAYRLFS